MTALQEQDSPKDQVRQTRGSLRDHSGSHSVEVYWDLNEDCIKDQIFKLAIDEHEVLLDAEQVKRLLRWV